MTMACAICGAFECKPIFGYRAPVFQLLRLSDPIDCSFFCNLTLVRCGQCGHLYNRDFDDSMSGRMYGDTPLTNIPVHVSMVNYLREIANWIGISNFAGKNVVEVGSGSGHMARICAQYARKVTGFEPCRGLSKPMVPEDNIVLFNTAFPPERGAEPADLVICRQVLEHVAQPLQFLIEIRGCLAPDGCVYIEIPTAEFIEDNGALSDVHLMHVNYFFREGFECLARRAGLRVERSLLIKDGHDIGFLCRPGIATRSSEVAPGRPPTDLQLRLQKEFEKGCRRFAEISGKIAFFGATPHAQSLFNVFGDALPRSLDRVFDDNACYIGYGLYNESRLVPVCLPDPEVVREMDAIVVTSYLHEGVIAEGLRKKGFRGDLLSIRPGGSRAGSGLRGIFD